MERAMLEDLLGQGLSLAEIGRRVGRHESTVGYWVRRHGLLPVHQARHADRGGLSHEQLAPLVEAALTVQKIAEELDRSHATVR